jgi:hypothetical protein
MVLFFFTFGRTSFQEHLIYITANAGLYQIKFSEAEPCGACTAPCFRAAEYFVPQGKNIGAHPRRYGIGDERKTE